MKKRENKFSKKQKLGWAKSIFVLIFLGIFLISFVNAFGDYYPEDMVLKLNFDNNISLGENGTIFKDTSSSNLSGYSYNNSNISYFNDGAYNHSSVNFSNRELRLIIENTPEINLTTSFSWSVAVKRTGQFSQYGILLGKNEDSATFYGHKFNQYAITTDSANGVYCVIAGYNSTGDNDWFYTSTSELPLNKWAIITCTYDGDDLRAYMDFSLESTATQTYKGNSNLSFPYVGGSFKIGGLTASTNNLLKNASIDNIRIWDRVLSLDDFDSIPITKCTSLTTSNKHYFLENNLIEDKGKSNNCLEINADNITIDMKGYEISKYKLSNLEWNDEDSGGTAINLNNNKNVTIKNGKFYNYWYGVGGTGKDIKIINNTFFNVRYGVSFIGNNSLIEANIFKSNSKGIVLSLSSYNFSINNNTFYYNDKDIYMYTNGTGSIISNNHFYNPATKIWEAYSTNFGNFLSNGGFGKYYVNNTYYDLVSLKDSSFSSQNINLGERVNFNITLRNIVGKVDSTANYQIILTPNESNLKCNENSGVITGNFTPTKKGTYNLKIIVNFTDTAYLGNNIEIDNYKIIVSGKSKTERFYFREQMPFTEDQITSTGGGYDIGEMIREPPTSEETRWCGQWYQFYMDEAPIYDNVFLKNASVRLRYNFSYSGGGSYNASDNIIIGFDQEGIFSGSGDDVYVLENNTQPTKTGVFNFSLNASINNLWEWYKYSFKVYEESTRVHKYPYMITSPENLSYIDLTYDYSQYPIIENDNKSLNILSAVTYNGDMDASILVDGEGWANFTIIMPHEATNGEYNIYYDGILCNLNSNCEYSINNKNFTMHILLGSEHTINITYESNSPQSSEETSSSSSGGGYPTYSPSQEQMQNGYSKNLGKNWKIKFNLQNETHELKINNIQNNSATITISSEPQTFNISINETKKINLNNDDYYDLQVFLKNITGNSYYKKAEINIKLINETISVPTETNQTNENILKEKIPSTEIKKSKFNYFIIFGTILIILVFFIVRKLIKNKRF